MPKFEQYAISKPMIHTLSRLGYVNLTPIQEAVIPHVYRGESVVARSETGSGKTHAFLVPILDRIDINKKEVQAIILSPTRELAKQTYDFAKLIQSDFPELKLLMIAGGVEKSRNKLKLESVPHVVIATPGRLKDLGIEDTVTSLSTSKVIVLDEADMLMDSGFFEDINLIISRLDAPQMLVFSATIPLKLSGIIEKYVGATEVIEIAKENKTSGQVTHSLIDTRHQPLFETILDFIKWKNPYFLLIFASKIDKVIEVYQFLQSQNLKVGMMHGNLENRERKAMMKRIRNNEFPIVVASDMAARGLDIEHVSDILNIDLPTDLDFYFHRAGRTGRYDKTGNCYTFYDNDHSERPRKLIELGVRFAYFSYRDHQFFEAKGLEYKRQRVRKIDPTLEKDIKTAVSKTRSTKVKPGYKKKVANAVEKVKKKYKRQIIEKDIRRQKVQRYKQSSKKEEA